MIVGRSSCECECEWCQWACYECGQQQATVRARALTVSWALEQCWPLLVAASSKVALCTAVAAAAAAAPTGWIGWVRADKRPEAEAVLALVDCCLHSNSSHCWYRRCCVDPGLRTQESGVTPSLGPCQCHRPVIRKTYTAGSIDAFIVCGSVALLPNSSTLHTRSSTAVSCHCPAIAAMGPANGNYASPAPSAPPPAYDYSWLSATRLTRFQAICSQYEISDYFASRLRSLERFDVVLLCDDSGSMRTPVAAPSAFAPSVTRWDELKQSVTILASIAACMDDDGIDVHFLNRQPMLAVRDATVIGPAFEPPPSGFTPIAAALQRILQQRAVSAPTGDCKQLLVVIFTDGEPTDDHGNVNLAQLQNVLNARQTHVYTTFVACTDEDVIHTIPHRCTLQRALFLP